ncbi:MAG TPA: TIGR04255 family protein [Lachnospiraceae bacterium]|nr:TIGR04255 family protein [Lachnospiraceae bacterium]
MKFSRQDLKFHLVKNIILRLDFQGVMPVELEKIVVDVKKTLKAEGFNRLNENIENSVEIKSKPSQAETPIQGISSLKVFSFINERRGLILSLSTNNIVISVNSSVYVPFKEYSDIFMQVVDLYRTEIDFFTVKRFGFRKINFCFLKDLTKLNDYFEERYINCNNIFDNSDTLICSRSETFELENGSKFNFRSKVEKGIVDEGVVYRIDIDSDVHTDNPTLIDGILNAASGLEEINSELFKMYSSCLKDRMILFLEGRELVPDDLEGVDINE